MKAIQIDKTGGADVMVLRDVETPKPAAGQVLVKIEASGVNFIDVYFREGRYPSKLPFIPGQEGAGVVAEVGEGVSHFKAGERVAWCGVQGSYAEYAAISAEQVVAVPEGIDARQAAAAMLQGITAQYLSHSTYPIRGGDRILVHAGAGGVGLLLIQIAKRLGAYVFTTVSNEEKAALARGAGADEVILYTKDDFAEVVKASTQGKMLHCVYDSVGATTFDRSLASLARRGMLVLFGASSGAVPPLDPIRLSQMGSLFLTRPSLKDHIATREELESRAGDVLRWVADGSLKLRVEHVYPLAEAAQAHRDLEGRKTTGKLVLVP